MKTSLLSLHTINKLSSVLVFSILTFNSFANNSEHTEITASPTQEYSIGTPTGSISVSPTGAALYEMQIDIPNGGFFAPKLSLLYNSQNTRYGHAGYGVEISGISAITRRGHDMFHDGKQQGVTYTENDNLVLDGKRLILISGHPLTDGAEYTVEGEPNTTVVAKGYGTNLYFEVILQGGLRYSFGNTTTSKQVFKDRGSIPKVASWFISKAVDRYGNEIIYDYMIDRLMVYPKSVTYGVNNRESRGLTNIVEFEYEGLDSSPSSFVISASAGEINKRLSRITSSSNGNLYREYSLKYRKGGIDKYSTEVYLDEIIERNGNGGTYSPMRFNWQTTAPNRASYDLPTPTDVNFAPRKEKNKTFNSFDINGDGISDLIRISNVTIGGKQATNVTISLSSRQPNNTVEWITKEQTFNEGYFGDKVSTAVKPSPSFGMDFDGDGLGDLVLPFSNFNQKGFGWFTLVVFPGANLVRGQLSNYQIVNNYTTVPVFTTMDIDGNGTEEIIAVDPTPQDRDIHLGVAQMYAPNSNKSETKGLIFSFPKNIEKLFAGDFNNDGLKDLLFLYSTGYKIYFNKGGITFKDHFSEDHSYSGTTLKDQHRMIPGDYNGDGLLDFAFNEKDHQTIWIAYNLGNGQFNVVEDIKLNIRILNSSSEDERFAIIPVDINLDGKTDLVMCRSEYTIALKKFKVKYVYDQTVYQELISTGNGFELSNRVTKKAREDDAFEGHILTGDFNGDGYIEVANYGTVINTEDEEFNNKIHVYDFQGSVIGHGRLSSVTNGLAQNSSFYYGSLSDPNVYSKTESSVPPINVYQFPIAVVSQTTVDNGVADPIRTKYQYSDLKIHNRGGGFMGFSSIKTTNLTTGTTSEKRITKIDLKRLQPTEIIETTSIGDQTSSSITTYTIVEKSGGNYFAYPSKQQITDLDGNTTVSLAQYDTDKCVLVQETVQNDGANMYKQVRHDGYINILGAWLPTKTTRTQKHSDDPSTYTNTTVYSYDNMGNVVSEVRNHGTVLALTTTNTYDVYGNSTSTYQSGYGVGHNKITNDYDETGRFIVSTSQSASSIKNLYEYDHWGNVIIEKVVSTDGDPQITKYEYDGWGKLKKKIDPIGRVTSWSYEWDYTDPIAIRCYSTFTISTNGAWSKTYYDDTGRELSKESSGIGGQVITTETRYSSTGEPEFVLTTTGELTQTEQTSYDKRGRPIRRESSSGRIEEYSYGNRKVTTSIGTNSYTKTYDAWGNIVNSSDPISSVTYKYFSNGKPQLVSTEGVITELRYDQAGNQIQMKDPAAGVTSYEYSADGKVLSQTDSRGIITTNTYNNLGQLTRQKVGAKEIHYEYGVSGVATDQLMRMSLDNNTLSYTYDNFGRISSETRTIDKYGSFTTSYLYDAKGLLKQKNYPGGLTVEYSYDRVGNMVRASIDGRPFYDYLDFNGKTSKSAFSKNIIQVRKRNDRGFETSRELILHNTVFESFTTNYDGLSGNLLSRKHNSEAEETFTYDELDRLTSASANGEEYLAMEYLSNGNISFKTSTGGYTYTKDNPYAINTIEKGRESRHSTGQHIVYNEFSKVASISEGDFITSDITNISYGPDLNRWYSIDYKLSHFPKQIFPKPKAVSTRLYAGNYERYSKGDTLVREFYYLEDNVIAIRTNGDLKLYKSFTDNLGSILAVVDTEGNYVFQASYDPWGNQNVKLNTIDLNRGYTGHEMLNQYKLINMNGRLYDPETGRFLSPDNFVQMPDFSQSFNRYSYCLNNPLKYTDPSGELAWFVPVIAGAIIGAYAGASIQSGTAAFWNWNSNAWKGAIVGGIIGATIGYGVSSALASSGGITGLTTTIKGTEVVAKSAGITSSILNSGSISIAYNAITGGSWDGAWKAGIVGLATGAWAITGGFGMVKGFGATSRLGKFVGKLGYQMIGTVSQSVGNNWASNKGVFSRVTLGVGPINLTLGKGQRLLQWENNLGNIAINAFGLVNTIAGGKVHFDTDNLTFEYTGGLMDIFQPSLSMHDDQLYKVSAGFSPHTVTGNSGLSVVLPHELHHLWQSRALNDLFLLNYSLQGLNALLLKGNFVAERNYYEDFVNHYPWWDTRPVWQ